MLFFLCRSLSLPGSAEADKLIFFLRFLAIFGLLVLLINPIISKNSLEITKTPLAIVVDNSSSITALKSDKKTVELYQKLISNPALKEKFQYKSVMQVPKITKVVINKGINRVGRRPRIFVPGNGSLFYRFRFETIQIGYDEIFSPIIIHVI